MMCKYYWEGFEICALTLDDMPCPQDCPYYEEAGEEEDEEDEESDR